MKRAPVIQRVRVLNWGRVLKHFFLEPGFKQDDLESNIDILLSCLVSPSNPVLIISL